MKPALYWHICSLNNWREVVVEQLRLLKTAGWTEPVNVGFAGSEEDFGFVWHAFLAAGMEVNLLGYSRVDEFEMPTQAKMLAHLKANPEIAWAGYFHSKGVSHVNHWVSCCWRWLMGASVLGNWKWHVAQLQAGFDVSGTSEMEPDFCGATPRTPYYAGTFWWASREHILALTPILTLLKKPLPYAAAAAIHPWMNSPRFLAEVWIGTRKGAFRGAADIPERHDYGNHHFWAGRVDLQRRALRGGALQREQG